MAKQSEIEEVGENETSASSHAISNSADSTPSKYDAFNEHEPWRQGDVIEMYRLYQYGVSLRRIARFLGRSMSSCQIALQKMMIQQILHHTVEEVTEHYGDDRIPNLLQSKYYVPLDKELSFATPKRTWDNTPWGMWVYIMFVFAVICYGKLNGDLFIDDEIIA